LKCAPLLRLGKLGVGDITGGVNFSMKNKLIFSAVFVWVALAQCLAQIPDSVRTETQSPVFQRDTLPTTVVEPVRNDTAIASTDSISPKKKGFLYRTFKSDYPNPNKALYLSLAFPAGGQLYNKRWWKAPIVWGGYAALIYSVKYNTYWYKEFRDAYRNKQLGLEQPYPQFNAGDLKTKRDQFDKNKQLSYIGIFGLHLIQAAEAFVDCHLKTFDVSDDLSLHLKPSLEASYASAYPVMGFGLSLSLGK